MISTKSEKFLKMLNHPSRELLQIMVAATMRLELDAAQDDDLQELIDIINKTFEAIEQQIESVSNFLSAHAEAVRLSNVNSVEGIG